MARLMGVRLVGVPADAWYDTVNPFAYLAGTAAKVVTDGWTAAMLGLWNAGLFALRLVLGLMDSFLTPDLRETGPGAGLYATTFWIAGTLAVLMGMIQLGTALLRRDGRALAELFLGLAQFAVVWAAWIVYAVTVVAACTGLTQALMTSLLRVSSWSAWQPWAAFTLSDITDATVATVLGLLGLLLWLAAIGHLLVMLTRAGALMVLAATTPICAAGLLSQVGRGWFFTSLRWFHSAALTPPLMVLVLGVGVQMTTGVANGQSGSTQAAIGTALPGVVLIVISVFCPLALFKLLAFIDPSTGSGAALRIGLAAAGGVQGVLGRAGNGGRAAGGAASSTDEHGRSAGEASADQATSDRFTTAMAGAGGQAPASGVGTGGTAAAGARGAGVGGVLAGAAAAGIGRMRTLGSTGAAIGSDLTNQMGVGHPSYVPDFSAWAAPTDDPPPPPDVDTFSAIAPQSGGSESLGPSAPPESESLAMVPDPGGSPSPPDLLPTPPIQAPPTPGGGPDAGPTTSPADRRSGPAEDTDLQAEAPRPRKKQL